MNDKNSTTKKKNNDRPADFFLLFATPVGGKGLCVGFWDYGDDASAPVEFLAKHMAGIVNTIQHRGYNAWRNTDPAFESYVVVKKGVDEDKAREIAKSFLVALGDGLVADLLGGNFVRPQ